MSLDVLEKILDLSVYGVDKWGYYFYLEKYNMCTNQGSRVLK